MLSVPVGDSATLTIPFQDDSGNALNVTAASFVVQDANGNELQSGDLGPITGEQATVNLSNTVTGMPGGRVLILNMTTAGGVVGSQTIFIVRAAAGARLVMLQNTFQTLAQAAFNAVSLPSTLNSSFLAATTSDQEVALIEACRRMMLLNYYIPWPEYVDVMNYLYPRYAWHITPRMWTQMTVSLYNQYPVAYHAAMQQAQVVEANAVLTGDPLDDQIKQGLLAWTVGESKFMFKPGLRPLKQQVSRDTMNYLKGWVDNRFTLTRS